MTNSPTTFQTIINDIFRNLIMDKIMIVYLDDILIFTQKLEDHYKTVCRVLEVLAKHQLYLYSEKYEIEYLRLVILENQVKIDSLKVADIYNQITLQYKTDMQIFLEFTNFYQRFICGFSSIVHPLFNIASSNSIYVTTLSQSSGCTQAKTLRIDKECQNW